MIPAGWRHHAELSALAVESRRVASGCVCPFADFVGHEANAVDARAVVEPVGIHHAIAAAEVRPHLYIQERIAGRWSVQRDLEDTPPLHVLRRGETQTEGQAKKRFHRQLQQFECTRLDGAVVRE